MTEKQRAKRMKITKKVFHPILGVRSLNGIEYDRLMAEPEKNGGWIDYKKKGHDSIIKSLQDATNDSGDKGDLKEETDSEQ